MVVGYTADILDELAASIIRTKMSRERKCSHCIVIGLQARVMVEEAGAVCGQVGAVDMELWQEDHFQGHSMDQKAAAHAAMKVSLVKMLTTLLFNLHHLVLSCVRYSGSTCVQLRLWL